MRRFTFSLEPLLKVKNVKKKKLERDMARAKQRLEEGKALLRQMQEEKSSLLKQIEKISIDGAKTSELKEYSLYFQVVCDRVENQIETCRRIENECEKIKAELIDLHKQIDVLEKLKTEQFKKYIFEMEKIQEKAVEELVNFNLTTRGECKHG